MKKKIILAVAAFVAVSVIGQAVRAEERSGKIGPYEVSDVKTGCDREISWVQTGKTGHKPNDSEQHYMYMLSAIKTWPDGFEQKYGPEERLAGAPTGGTYKRAVEASFSIVPKMTGMEAHKLTVLLSDPIRLKLWERPDFKGDWTSMFLTMAATAGNRDLTDEIGLLTMIFNTLEMYTQLEVKPPATVKAVVSSLLSNNPAGFLKAVRAAEDKSGAIQKYCTFIQAKY